MEGPSFFWGGVEPIASRLEAIAMVIVWEPVLVSISHGTLS